LAAESPGYPRPVYALSLHRPFPAIRFNSGTLYVTAYEISSSSDYAVEYNACYASLCRINNARLVSTADGGRADVKPLALP
jgi:hypothetical protein